MSKKFVILKVYYQFFKKKGNPRTTKGNFSFMSPRKSSLTQVGNCITLRYLALTLALVGAGCASHLHDPARKGLAEKAEKQLGALIKEEQQVLSDMKTNLDAMSGFEGKAYKKMEELKGERSGRKIKRLTWKELREHLDKENGLAQEISASVKEMAEEINKEQIQVGKDKKVAAAALAKAETDLKKAKTELTDWNRRIAVLEKLIEITPNLETALSDVKDATHFKEQAEKVAKEVGEAKVTFKNEVTGENETIPLREGISPLLDVNNLLSAQDPDAPKVYLGINKIFRPEAPGLVITVAALAKDLAEGEQVRAQSKLSTLQKRHDLLKRAERIENLAHSLSKQGYMGINDSNEFPDDKNVLATLESFAKKLHESEKLLSNLQKENESLLEQIKPLNKEKFDLNKKLSDLNKKLAELSDGQEKEATINELTDTQDKLSGTEGKLANLEKKSKEIGEAIDTKKTEVTKVKRNIEGVLVALQNFVIIDGRLDNRLASLKREDAYLRHLQSLETSRVNAVQNEALIGRGIEGLVVYHTGGIKPEQIAKIAFDIANLAVFSAIAGGVY